MTIRIKHGSWKKYFLNVFFYKKQLIRLRNDRLNFLKLKETTLPELKKLRNFLICSFNFPRSFENTLILYNNSGCYGIVLSANYVITCVEILISNLEAPLTNRQETFGRKLP